jgi:hypothetical protein
VLLASIAVIDGLLAGFRAATGRNGVSANAATTVLASLIGYAVLPRRPATFLILLTLGPLTLIRPWVAVAAGLTAAWTAPDLGTAGCAVLAAISVLAVEPWVHHRWYADPA